MKYRLILLLILFCAVLGAFYLFKFFIHQSPATYYISLTKDGFSPSNITINQGDMVVFTTRLTKPFWPASDIHPTHTLYPEFDPKRPIDSDKSWSFKFDKAGNWKFHDHLDPYYQGIVKVRGSDGKIPYVDCVHVSEENRAQCWDTNIDSIIESKGLEGTFNMISDSYNNDPDFKYYCHGLVHKLGEKAYYLFSEHKNFTLPEKVSYCSFGFYHGFMQTLLHETNDLSVARDFCNYAYDKMKNVSADTLGKCYHGIGHGAVDDDNDWPNERSVVMPALALCEKVAPNPQMLNRCGSGVFNAMAIAYNQGKLRKNESDPLFYCRSLEKDYAKLTCYEEMNTYLMAISNSDFLKAIKFVEAIKEDEYAISTMRSLSDVNGQSGWDLADYSKQVKVCQSLQKRLVTPCIEGYIEGLIEVGTPDLEYTKPLAFCANPLLTEEQKIACYNNLIWQESNIYPAEKQKYICSQIDVKYNKKCAPVK